MEEEIEDKVQERFRELTVAIVDSMEKEAEKVLTDLARRNMVNSGPGIKTLVEKQMVVLKEESLDLLQKINTLQPSANSWEQIRKDSQTFVEAQFKAIYNEVLQRWRPEKPIAKEIEKIMARPKQLILSELNTYIDSCLTILQKQKEREIRGIIWEVGKILFSALIGYLIGRFT